jgi:hypothetical protein
MILDSAFVQAFELIEHKKPGDMPFGYQVVGKVYAFQPEIR